MQNLWEVFALTNIFVPDFVITYDKKSECNCEYTRPFCRMSGVPLYKKIGEKYVIEQ